MIRFLSSRKLTQPRIGNDRILKYLKLMDFIIIMQKYGDKVCENIINF